MLQYIYKFYVGGANLKSKFLFHAGKRLPLINLCTEHAASHLLLLGEDMNVFMDLLTLCNFCILSNMHDPCTYNFLGLTYGNPVHPTHLAQRQKYNYNALSPDDRHYYSYMRGLAINLINWVHCNYVFYDKKKCLYDFTSLSHQYLHHQVQAIIVYQKAAEQTPHQGVLNCTEEALRHQAELLFSPYFVDEFQGFSLSEVENEETLSWEGFDGTLHLKSSIFTD
jgi:hypothetical protein